MFAENKYNPAQELRKERCPGSSESGSRRPFCQPTIRDDIPVADCGSGPCWGGPLIVAWVTISIPREPQAL